MAAKVSDLVPPGQRSLVGSYEILRALVHKELKVKYKRSILGVAWSLFTPLALTGVYLFVFVYVHRLQQPDFIFFLVSGTIPWQYFNLALIAATNSFVDNFPVVKKVRFPLGLIPASTVGANLINFLMVIASIVVIVAITGRPVWLQLHWLVLAILLETAVCLGLALSLSVWNVYFRDIGSLISTLMVVWFFATPIVYPFDKVPEQFKTLVMLNPMTSVMELYHSALFYLRPPDPKLLLTGIAEVAVILVFGLLVLRRNAANLPKEL